MPDRPVASLPQLDHLDRALDIAAAGMHAGESAEIAFDGHPDPALLATIDTLWSLNTRATPPGPDAAFIDRLRDDLMHASPLPQAHPASIPIRPASHHASDTRTLIPAWVTSGAGAFSTAVTIAVVIALVIASISWWDRARSPVAPTPSEVAFGVATPPPASAGSTPAASTPVAPLDVPPISTAGGPGRSWALSDTNLRTDGTPRQITADANFTVTSALVVGDSIVISGQDTTSRYGMGEIRRIDLRTGKTIWSVPAKPFGDLAAQGNLLYTFTLDLERTTDLKLRVSAFSLSTGEEVWTGPELGPGPDATSGEGPILMDGMLFASDPAGNTVALDPATGEQHWQYPKTPFAAPGTIGMQSSMIGTNGSIIVATTDKHLVRLDTTTGAVQAESTLDSTIHSITLQASTDGTVVACTFPSEEGRFEYRLVNPTTLALGDPVGQTFPGSATMDGTILATNTTGGVRTDILAITLPKTPDDSPTTTRLTTLDGPSIAGMVVSGTTMMGVGTSKDGGEIDFVDTRGGATTRIALPVATPWPFGILPPMLWGDVPVVVVGDGTIWALDGDTTTTKATTAAIAIGDDGFARTTFDAKTDADGVARITLRNDGTQARVVVIPSLGIDARMPARTSLTVARTIGTEGAYAIFTRTAAGIDPTPTSFAELHMSGTTARSASQQVTIAGVSDIGYYEQIAPGTAILARPDTESSAITKASTSVNVMPLMVTEAPSTGFATVTDANGTEWSLVLSGTNTIGWVPSDSISLLPSDAMLRATPTATAIATSTPSGMLNPNSETLRISIDIDGVIAGDAQAIQQLDGKLQRVLAPYVETGTCQIGFVLISTKAPDISTGIQASDAVAERTSAVAPSLIPAGSNGRGELVSESITLLDQDPASEVQLEIFVNQGCTVPASNATPAG
ncbi:MAG: PQQ-binding-like beta-propeller repeat protein [Thermomicrobiales bacterium]